LSRSFCAIDIAMATLFGRDIAIVVYVVLGFVPSLSKLDSATKARREITSHSGEPATVPLCSITITLDDATL